MGQRPGIRLLEHGKIKRGGGLGADQGAIAADQPQRGVGKHVLKGPGNDLEGSGGELIQRQPLDDEAVGRETLAQTCVMLQRVQTARPGPVGEKQVLDNHVIGLAVGPKKAASVGLDQPDLGRAQHGAVAPRKQPGGLNHAW